MSTLVLGIRHRADDGVAVGSRVLVRPDVAAVYRKPGSSLEGCIVGVSPSGDVARVRLDAVADSYVRTEHLTACQEFGSSR